MHIKGLELELKTFTKRHPLPEIINELIEEYGKKPGTDIVVIGVDAIKKSFETMKVKIQRMGFEIIASPKVFFSRTVLLTLKK